MRGPPQKEYGYRNGQLLITATAGTSWASATTFANNPLVVGETTVQALHITQLRDAINALRGHLSLSAYSWQYSATTNDYISANPILEMRTALDQALGAPAPAYSAGLAQGQPIKAIHIQELRDRVLAAWSTGTALEINWLVADQLGTPRMVFDQSGNLAGVKRHDYLPFGEELVAGTSGRTTTQGYSGDNLRQKFAGSERDNETGLDYMKARYYSATMGRFTSVDPSRKSIIPTNPQTWNRYSYTYNNPLKYVDENRKWPTETHNKMIRDAFPGLSAREIRQIQRGSENVDVKVPIHLAPGKYGTIGWPSTLFPDQAFKHAMTPEGWTKKDARNAALQYIDQQADTAKSLQASFQAQGGRGNALTAYSLSGPAAIRSWIILPQLTMTFRCTVFHGQS